MTTAADEGDQCTDSNAHTLPYLQMMENARLAAVPTQLRARLPLGGRCSSSAAGQQQRQAALRRQDERTARGRPAAALCADTASQTYASRPAGRHHRDDAALQLC